MTLPTFTHIHHSQAPTLPGFRPMTVEDAPQVRALLNEYMKRYASEYELRAPCVRLCVFVHQHNQAHTVRKLVGG